MQGEHFREDFRMRRHPGEGGLADGWVIAQGHQQPGHPLGTTRDAAMCARVLAEIAARDGFGQRGSLTKRQAQPFAGNRIHRA